jgi:hypothetical protein
LFAFRKSKIGRALPPRLLFFLLLKSYKRIFFNLLYNACTCISFHKKWWYFFVLIYILYHLYNVQRKFWFFLSGWTILIIHERTSKIIAILIIFIVKTFCVLVSIKLTFYRWSNGSDLDRFYTDNYHGFGCNYINDSR